MSNKKYNVVSTKAVAHTISPVGGVISSAIIMKPTEVHIDIIREKIAILVSIVDIIGKPVRRERLEYKISTLLGNLGGISLEDFITNIDQLLVDVIDMTNLQYIQAGVDKRVFYGLLKADMQLVEILENVPGAE
jgi:hypothetical protein